MYCTQTTLHHACDTCVKQMVDYKCPQCRADAFGFFRNQEKEKDILDIKAHCQYCNQLLTVCHLRKHENTMCLRRPFEEKQDYEGVRCWMFCTSYVGQIDYEQDIAHGYGRATFASGTIWKGMFQNGILHGSGCKTYKCGMKIKGNFIRGVLHGKGEKHYINGLSQYGIFKHGLLHGRGQLFVNGRLKYQGDFQGGKLNGSGMMIVYSSVDIKTCIEPVKESQKNGETKSQEELKNTHNTKPIKTTELQQIIPYDTKTKPSQELKPPSKSTIYMIYMGCFKDGLQHGYGREHYVHSGEIHFGEWDTGKPNGKKYVCVMKKQNDLEEGISNVLNSVPSSPKVYKKISNSIYIV